MVYFRVKNAYHFILLNKFNMNTQWPLVLFYLLLIKSPSSTKTEESLPNLTFTLSIQLWVDLGLIHYRWRLFDLMLTHLLSELFQLPPQQASIFQSGPFKTLTQSFLCVHKVFTGIYCFFFSDLITKFISTRVPHHFQYYKEWYRKPNSLHFQNFLWFIFSFYSWYLYKLLDFHKTDMMIIDFSNEKVVIQTCCHLLYPNKNLNIWDSAPNVSEM